MTAVRHLALWFAAVIMMIGVSLTPSAAHAHSVGAESAHGASVSHAQMHQHASAKGVGAASIGSAPIHPGCSDACCGAGGHVHCCGCASGLTPAAVLSLVPPTGAGGVFARNLPDRAAIVPEALPEPPRHLA